MEKDVLFDVNQVNCNHKKQELYKQERLDIPNGFELTLTRCLNCHKIIELEAKKFSKQ